MSSYAKTIIQETLMRQPFIAPDFSATATAIEKALLDAGFDIGHGHVSEGRES